MSYNYKTQKPFVFTDEGQRHFLHLRDAVRKIMKTSGAMRLEEMMMLPSSDGGWSTWDRLACVDRMVELGELACVNESKAGAAQARVFVYTREL